MHLSPTHRRPRPIAILAAMALLTLHPLATYAAPASSPARAGSINIDCLDITDGTPKPDLLVLGLPFVNDILFKGTIAAVQDSTARFTQSPFGPTDFPGDASLYYGEIATGPNAGGSLDVETILVGTSTIRFTEPLAPLLAPGDEVIIRKHNTLQSLFGPANPYGLSPIENRTGADEIILWDAAAGTRQRFAYSTTRAAWVTLPTRKPAPANTIIEPAEAVILLKRSTKNLFLPFTGTKLTHDYKVQLSPGINLVTDVTDTTTRNTATPRYKHIDFSQPYHAIDSTTTTELHPWLRNLTDTDSTPLWVINTTLILSQDTDTLPVGVPVGVPASAGSNP
ncbi:MAG: hypothetical protein SFY80_16020 [Verrucomicrobiota bacterium]|nr:hypothetical protein [Verrucomicrobiota bacterium]